MTLTKVTFDNSVNYFSKSEQTEVRDSKANTIKNSSNPRKQNKKISQNNKELGKNVAARGLGLFK